MATGFGCLRRIIEERSRNRAKALGHGALQRWDRAVGRVVPLDQERHRAAGVTDCRAETHRARRRLCPTSGGSGRHCRFRRQVKRKTTTTGGTPRPSAFQRGFYIDRNIHAKSA